MMTRFLGTVPEPWTRANIETAIFKSFSDARAAIEDTAGGKVWRALQHLEDAVWIFEASATELLDEMCLFGDRSKNPAFWHEANASEAEKHTRAVKRKLFYCTSAVMALVDHARVFQDATPVAGYADRLKAVFSTPGLHEFLQCLRNYNSHWRIAQAHWVIQQDLRPHSRQARFTVTRPELLAWGGWTAPARGFIEAAPEAIDVYELLASYRAHVQSFYAWHRGAVIDAYAAVLQPYLEYKRLYEGLLKKYNWNLVLSHVPKNLNPFQYLGQYLPAHEVERLLAYEHRSDAQVDALIRMVGMEEFCDEALRQKVLALFRRPA